MAKIIRVEKCFDSDGFPECPHARIMGSRKDPAIICEAVGDEAEPDGIRQDCPLEDEPGKEG